MALRIWIVIQYTIKMYPLAHIGIGYTMIQVWPKIRRLKLPVIYLISGCLISDVMDKSLYYGIAFYTHKRGTELGFLAGTRSFGHTLIFFLAVLALSRWQKSKKILALALGILTHLILDQVSDFLISGGKFLQFKSLLWPLFGWNFPTVPYGSFSEQVGFSLQPVPLISEGLGCLLLLGAAVFIQKRRIQVLTDPATQAVKKPSSRI